MTTTPSRLRLWLRLPLLLATLATLLLTTSTQAAPATPPRATHLLQSSIVHRPSSIVQQSSQEASRSTDYFTIYYPNGEEKTADWYAGFIDEVDRAVSELLGADPITGMTLRVFATEPDYWAANPMAQIHPGILAHAIPDQKEIGVAVERLRQQPPALARESFRHEITHIVAGALSDQNLPIGFQEALAQYNELSSTRGEEAALGLKAAQDAGTPLLSWSDLNEANTFRQNIEVAYPQSYSVMAFLADRYGMEPFVRFLQALSDDYEYRHAILLAYEKTLETLEKEWREYLPGFISEGYKRNVLSAHDLDYGLSLMGVGKFAEAEEHFTQAQRLYSDLGRNDRASRATAYLANATKAKEADASATQARKDLEAYNYAKALDQAQAASQAFAELNFPEYELHASDISQLAQTGLNAIANMERARSSAKALDLTGARTLASEAGQAFSSLGDAQRVGEANALLADISNWQYALGFALLGVGALVLVAITMGIGTVRLRARKRKIRGTELAPTPMLREENQSWL